MMYACRVCYLGITTAGVACPPTLRPMLLKASACESSSSSSSSNNSDGSGGSISSGGTSTSSSIDSKVGPAQQLLQCIKRAIQRPCACLQVGGSILGGEQRNKEKARLRKGITVLVASPGRLLDHLEKTTAFKTDELRWLVLDEADRLLDMGFQQKIGMLVPQAPRG